MEQLSEEDLDRPAARVSRPRTSAASTSRPRRRAAGHAHAGRARRQVRVRRLGPAGRAARLRAARPGPRLGGGRRGRRRRSPPATPLAHLSGARPRDPDGRARGAEPPPAHVRHRDRDAALRRRGRGHGLPHPRHAQDRAGPARRSTARPCATAAASNHRYDLTEMVLIKDNHRRLAGGVAPRRRGGARGRARRRRSKSRSSPRPSSREAVAAGADRILIDNQSPETVARWCAIARQAARPPFLEASGQHAPRHGARLRAGRRGRRLRRRADALGRARPTSRSSSSRA